MLLLFRFEIIIETSSFFKVIEGSKEGPNLNKTTDIPMSNKYSSYELFTDYLK